MPTNIGGPLLDRDFDEILGNFVIRRRFLRNLGHHILRAERIQDFKQYKRLEYYGQQNAER